MSVFRPARARCSCGAAFSASVAYCVNIQRTPSAREAILKGTFHRFRCPGCGVWASVEARFLYVDSARSTVIEVLPRRARPEHRRIAARLDASLKHAAGVIGRAEHRRVVFGLRELREKLLAQEAGIDDRLVEFIKALLLREHPILMRKPRLCLNLDRVSPAGASFTALYEHDPSRYRVDVPRWLTESLVEGGPALIEHARKALPGGAITPPSESTAWVSVSALEPQHGALGDLQEFAQRVRDGLKVDLTSPEFDLMLRRIPRGTQLPEWAKGDLRVLESYAKLKGRPKAQRQIFDVRFDKELDDDWATNDQPDDIDTLWKLLEDLPDTNVEGNTSLRRIDLEPIDLGGYYDADSGRIVISSAETLEGERFEDVVRHEVGHAVNDKLGATVTDWLATRFGWRMLQPDAAGIDEWVALMGGWKGVSASDQARVRSDVQVALGPGGTFDRGPNPVSGSDDPWLRADCAARLAYENSMSQWWNTFHSYHRAPGAPVACFMNYYYRTLCVVGVETLDLVARMPRAYAAMSPAEFFAELYALYYDSDDPGRGEIPDDVAKWLDLNVGAAASSPAPAPSSPSASPVRAAEHVAPGRWTCLTRTATDAKPARAAREANARARSQAPRASEGGKAKRKRKPRVR
jgi:hypothetical protein